MSRLEVLVQECEPCAMASSCRNSPENAAVPECSLCSLSPATGIRYGDPVKEHRWRPVSSAGRVRHPFIEIAKRNASRKRRLDKQKQRMSRDIGKRKLQRKARLAEKRTEKLIIRATRNSGRKNRDGDHISMGQVVLDTKLQSTRVHPLVRVDELEKVRQDAARNGYRAGGLVIQTESGSVVVFSLQDYQKLFGGQLEDSRPERDPGSN